MPVKFRFFSRFVWRVSLTKEHEDDGKLPVTPAISHPRYPARYTVPLKTRLQRVWRRGVPDWRSASGTRSCSAASARSWCPSTW